MIPVIVAELAGRADRLDMKLQSLCGNGFSLFAVRILAKPYHFWSELMKNLQKQRWGTFLYPQI